MTSNRDPLEPSGCPSAIAPPSALTISGTNAGNGARTEGVLAEKLAAVAQPDPGLLIRCFCAGLLDENVLVQRGFLDLLVERVPLNSIVLQDKAAREDLKKRVMASTSAVLRRDMSLNRRLWAWFLGPTALNDTDDSKTPASPNPAALQTPTTAENQFSQMSYFVDNALPVLVETLKAQLEAPTVDAADKTKTLRMCLALMDRFEIGNSLITHIYVPALSSVQDFQNSKAPKSAKSEVLRSGSAFFDSVESFVIWHEIIELINVAFEAPEPEVAMQKLNLVAFVLSRFNVREEDMLAIHIPRALLVTLHGLSATNDLHAGVEDALNSVLELASSLISALPEHNEIDPQMPDISVDLAKLGGESTKIVNKIKQASKDMNRTVSSEGPDVHQATEAFGIQHQQRRTSTNPTKAPFILLQQ